MADIQSMVMTPTPPQSGERAEALERVARAAKVYYTGYCQDEAEDANGDWTGCSREQFIAAKELKEAIAALDSEESK